METKARARLVEIEVEFKKLQQELNEGQAKLLKLDGEYAGLKKLLGEDKVVEMKK